MAPTPMATHRKKNSNRRHDARNSRRDMRMMKCIVVVSRQSVASSVDGHGAFGLLHDAAVTKRDRHVGNRGDLGIVGDEDERRASRAVDLQQQVDDVAAGRAVEIAGRFVRQQDRRVVGERAGDRDALLLAARELRRVVMAAAREPDFAPAEPSRASAGSGPPAISIGTRTFSNAVSDGSRWKN